MSGSDNAPGLSERKRRYSRLFLAGRRLAYSLELFLETGNIFELDIGQRTDHCALPFSQDESVFRFGIQVPCLKAGVVGANNTERKVLQVVLCDQASRLFL